MAPLVRKLDYASAYYSYPSTEPPLRWLPVRPRSLDVRDCNLVELTSESGLSQALVIPDRFPAVPSVSR